uniref:Uncharacterized protein n=1 Tax=Centropogon granulosus TaxID=434389 RepID=A0A1Z2QRS4_9ASTR|nr:hypothetical protein Ce_gra1Pt0118 [Centropogon granulosus]ASA34140.1 hypothetical protein Ce_gra1Pt0118 [Centropogon granulosus]
MSTINCNCHGCDFFTYSGLSRPKDSIKKNEINGKKFPEWEKNSIFPQTEETGRKLISDRNEHEPALTCPHRKKCHGYKHEPALTCPHRKKCHGYKHSYNKDHCETYANDTCKIFLEAFHAGSAAGERWLTHKIKINRLSKNRNALEALQGDIKSLLKEEAQKPKTKLNTWNLGFWHGAFLRLKTISPED